MKKLIYNSNLENLSLQTVDNFFSFVRKIGKDKKEIFIALSGGTSLNNFYENLLILSSSLEKNYWDKIKFCFADERVVSLNDEDSNYKQLKETFLDSLIEKKLISQKQIIKINPNEKNPQIEYSKLIPRIDIFLFGSGPDGHIASLFPNNNLLEKEENNYLLIEDSPKPPAKRITISKTMIKNSQVSFIFFINEGKQKAFENFRNENLSFKNCPAKLALNSENTFIVTNLE